MKIFLHLRYSFWDHFLSSCGTIISNFFRKGRLVVFSLICQKTLFFPRQLFPLSTSKLLSHCVLQLSILSHYIAAAIFAAERAALHCTAALLEESAFGTWLLWESSLCLWCSAVCATVIQCVEVWVSLY